MPVFSSTALGPVRWLAAETLVVVLGILIAFQVDKWRSDLADRSLEARYLEELLADLEDDDGQLERAIGQRQEQIPVLRELIVRLEAPDTTQADAPELLALQRAYLGGMTLFDPVRTTVDTLVGSGGLALVEDRSLARKIVEY